MIVEVLFVVTVCLAAAKVFSLHDVGWTVVLTPGGVGLLLSFLYISIFHIVGKIQDRRKVKFSDHA